MLSIVLSIIFPGAYTFTRPALGQSSSNITTTYDTGPVFCSDGGQICDNHPTFTVTTSSVLQAQFTNVAFCAQPGITCCSTVIYSVSVDGGPLTSLGTITGSGTGPLVDLGPVSSGSHTLQLTAEGVEGGCNFGTLVGGGGSLVVTTNKSSQPPDTPPVAVATSDPPVGIVGNEVTLDGSQSNDPDGDELTFHWQQDTTNGSPQVTITNPDSDMAAFVAPDHVPSQWAGNDQTLPLLLPLQFSLTVTDSRGSSSDAELSVPIQCDPATEEKIASLIPPGPEVEVKAIENGFALLSYTQSLARLQHWRAGSGIDLPLDSGWLKTTTTIQAAEAAQQQRFETAIINLAEILPVGGPTTTYTFTFKNPIDKQTVYTNNDYDLYYAVGAINLTSTGTFQITHDKANHVKITGTVTHSIKDRYDFNPGDVFSYTKLGLTYNVYADDLNLLKTCKGAKDFDQNAGWIQNLITQGNPQSLREHIGKPNDNKWIWSDPSSTAQIPPPTLPFSS
jgi:hypothetical protein